jgi:uncharacterized membrane protein YuzA (DUF378 family)
MRTTTLIAQILLIVGGLNWLLVGLLQFDLVAALFGGQTAPVSRIVYVLVGLCAIWQLVRLSTFHGDRPVITKTGTTTRTTDRT